VSAAITGLIFGDPRLSKGELVNVGKTFGMVLHFSNLTTRNANKKQGIF